MGGVSFSTMDNDSGIWQGTVTDDNNGGFVGIRSTQPLDLGWDLTKCQGLEFTFSNTQSIQRQPRRLKVVLRDSVDFNGIAWSTSVDLSWPNEQEKQGTITTTANTMPIRVPFMLNDGSAALVPTRFARIVKNTTSSSSSLSLNRSHITAIQLVYSKFELEGELNPYFQVGDFQLQLLQVQTY